MNIDKLRQAEATFLTRFPLGFGDPGLERIRKTHNVERLAEFAQENVTRASLAKPHEFAETFVTIVSRASMVSRFEKPAFRNFVQSLDSTGRRRLAEASEKRLFGRGKRAGFEALVELLAQHKLARWSIVSALPFYFAPRKEVFVKPTTAKKIVSFLEIDELEYRPRPDWSFYDGYRKLIEAVKREVDPSLQLHNAAITGFLMASI